jgi:hypothetical protein
MKMMMRITVQVLGNKYEILDGKIIKKEQDNNVH